MKIVAAIMDISSVKKDGKIKQYFITKVKKYLVYDPRKVIIRDTDAAHAKQIR